MSIENRHQWESTRVNLRELEELYERKKQESTGEHIQELTLRSLKKQINQFKEEIASVFVAFRSAKVALGVATIHERRSSLSFRERNA